MVWKWKMTPTNALAKKKFYRTIAVDLTPVLPGGENGGAKIFVLELLQLLSEAAPQTQFILLTQASSHEELAELDSHNMRRLILDRQVSRLPLSIHVARIFPRIPGRIRRIIGHLLYKLNKIIKQSNPVGLLHDIGADLLFCPFTAPTYQEQKIPTVCTIYDLQYKTYPEFFTELDVDQRDHNFKEACRKATLLVAISDYSRDSAITHGNLDPLRIRTIYLRMPQNVLLETDHANRVLERFGLTPKQYLMYPANFWKHKNHQVLLTSFGMACHKGLPKNIKLICTGAPGPQKDWLMKAAQVMNLSERVLFPGYLPTEELFSLMTNCGGLVFPSLYEGFGMPVIEAMAAGIPVACSSVAALREVVADSAILFDPRIPSQISQSMIALVNDDELRARLIQAGLRRAALFTNTNLMVKEYLDVFQSALGGGKQLTGIYDDGWIGKTLKIKVPHQKRSASIKLELVMPKWLPQQSIHISASHEGQVHGPELVMKRGTKNLLTLPVNSGIDEYKVDFTPTFIASLFELGEDQRELSLILMRCGVVRDDGEYIELFVNKVSS